MNIFKYKEYESMIYRLCILCNELRNIILWFLTQDLEMAMVMLRLDP